MCLRCYRGLFRYTRGNAELSVPAHVFGLRFVRCHSLHVYMYATVGTVQVRSIRRSVSNCRHAISNDYEDVNLVQNDDDAHEGGSDDDDDDAVENAVENAVGDSC